MGRKLGSQGGILDNHDKITVIIGGDIVPTPSNYAEFIAGDVQFLLGDDLLDIIKSADLSVFNLETPLADSETPIMKCGPNLSAPTSCAAGLRAINPGVFALANNHIMDQGEAGLCTTLSALNEVCSPCFGAGACLAEARQPYLIKVDNITVGILACVEHEFSVAGEETSGANPFDPLETLGDICELKRECDYLIILYHGGKEHYRYPSPMLQRRCRAMVRAGADLVLCQHSHCVGCEERWFDGTIVYGQGNFLFDLSDDECWQTGLLVRVELNDRVEVSYVPVKKDGPRVRLAEDDDARTIIEGFRLRSEEISCQGFVEERYRAFALESVDSYLNGFVPWIHTLPFRIANRLCGRKLVQRSTDTTHLLAELNHIECEAHRELFIAGLKELLTL